MAFEIPAVIKEHPYVSGVTVFLVGIFVLYELGWFGGSSGGTTGGDPTLTAYYQAESAAQQSGNALAIAQDQNATAVNLAQVSAGVQSAAISANQTIQLGGQGTAADINNQNVTGAVQIVGSQGGTLLGVTGLNTGAATQIAQTEVGGATTIANTQAQAAELINGNNVQGAVQIAGLGANTAGTVAALNAGASSYIAGLSAGFNPAQAVQGGYGSNIFNRYALSYGTAGSQNTPGYTGAGYNLPLYLIPAQQAA